jgi:DNA-binding response OmpR family regulator
MARILIIDDDEVARLTLGSALEAEGHEVAYASNGEVGLALYMRRPFPLVVIDLVMPVKNGLQTILDLREFDANARVIAITGLAPEDLDLAEDFGAMRTMVKPIEPKDFVAMVHSVLRVSSGWDAVKDREL